jgi:hypothetical protein
MESLRNQTILYGSDRCHVISALQSEVINGNGIRSANFKITFQTDSSPPLKDERVA